MTDQTVERLDWGSDIASVRSGCGIGWQVLVTGNGQSPDETVRAEIDREPVATGQPAEFEGGITAFWADSDGSGALAVSRKFGNGEV